MAHPQYWTLLFYKKCLIISYSIFYCCYAQSYTFTKQPKSVLVAEGQAATLSCEWTPALNNNHNLLWVYFSFSSSTKSIEESNDKYNVTTEATSSHLSIFNFGSNDVGRYRCDIYDGASYFYSDDVYVVLGELTCNPENNNGEIGTTLTCSYTSSYPAYAIDLLWYKDGNIVISDKQDKHVLESRPLTAEDDGAVFTCKATTGSQVIETCETTPLILTINAEIVQSPPGPLQVGESFNLTCSGKGNPDYYNYEWTWNKQPVASLGGNSRIAVGNVFTVKDVSSSANGKIVTCTIGVGRNSSTARYTINVSENILSTTPQSTKPSFTDKLSETNTTDEPQTLIIVIGVVAIAIVILITAIIIYILYKRRKRQYDKKTKPESVPLKEPMYNNIEQDINSSEKTHVENGPLRETLKTDLSIYDEPTISNSNTQLETMYAEPDRLVIGHDARYDTPRNAVSLDNIDSVNEASDANPRKTKSRESIDAMYAKPNKSRSKESIDDLYSQPNKPNANTSIEAHSKESIDDLYAKPNKSTTNTPDPTKKNVEGLTYADIEFKSGTFPTPEPQDYGLDYATVQTIK